MRAAPPVRPKPPVCRRSRSWDRAEFLAPENMITVCEVCGNIGYERLLLCCRDCKCTTAHQYCLDEVLYDASLADWFCYECLQRRGEVTCSRSLEKVSSERPPSHVYFGSTVYQPITKRVESGRDAGPWRNRKGKSYMTKYGSLNKIYSSRKKCSKKKSNMRPIGSCTNRNKYWTAASLRNSMDKSEVHGDSNSNAIDGLTLEREKEEVRFQLDYRANNELPQRSMAANVPKLSTLQNDAVDKVKPYSPNDGGEKVFSCPGIKKIQSVRERSVDSRDISIIPQHDTTESSESSERFTESQKGSSCHRGKTVNMATASSSSDESGEGIPSVNESLESDDLQAPPGTDYILSYRSYLSEAQKKRVLALIQEIQPEITVFVAVMRKSSVRPPGPFLGISKEYALAHFPHKSTNITLQMPGKSKKWHPKFYKRDNNRKYMLMGQWLDFVRDNHVQEGDIFLLLPTKGGRRSTFMVYLLCATATPSRSETGFHSVSSCHGRSSTKMASEVHIMKEQTDGEHVSLESDIHEISHESLKSKDSGCLSQPPYIVPCKSALSKSQKKIVEERVRAIRSEVPICVAVMKNNNVGVAQRWMLELGSRYASVHLPTRGQTVVLQCGGKIWEAKMMFHNGRRWFLNGGWPKFARDNGLCVGDICLFELKKNERKLTMVVHIIGREQF